MEKIERLKREHVYCIGAGIYLHLLSWRNKLWSVEWNALGAACTITRNVNFKITTNYVVLKLRTTSAKWQTTIHAFARNSNI